MSTIVTRSGKGSPLTNTEVDANFTNLNTDKLEISGGTMTGNVLYNDNIKAKFGAGSDLQIYHYGGNSFISESGSGSLFVNASNLVLRNTSGEYYFYGNSDGSVNLYHDNAAKLATTATGISVTGSLAVSDASTTRTNLDVDQAGSALAFAIALG
jgi:hypothetical protein